MHGVLLPLLSVVDLALFVLVFLIVRSRRARAERMVTVIGLSMIRKPENIARTQKGKWRQA
jgi:hypothetical protein